MNRRRPPLLRWAITAAAVAIESRWEVAYGHSLELGWLAWALPLLTSGYLWLAMDRRARLDVALALAVVTCSATLGALSAVYTLPPFVLAVWTALLVALVVYRVHVIDDDRPTGRPDAGDRSPVEAVTLRPVAQPVAELELEHDDDQAADELEAPTEAPEATISALEDAELIELFSRRYATSAPMSVDEIETIRGCSRDAARAWHRRAVQKVSAA